MTSRAPARSRTLPPQTACRSLESRSLDARITQGLALQNAAAVLRRPSHSDDSAAVLRSDEGGQLMIERQLSLFLVNKMKNHHYKH